MTKETGSMQYPSYKYKTEEYSLSVQFRSLLEAVEPGFFKRKMNRIRYDRIISKKNE